MEELGENNRNISLIPLNHSPDASLPIFEENMAMENNYVASEEVPVETYYPSPLRLLKKANSSSLLSRRSKSIDPLGVHTGDDGTQIQENNDTETICRVLFDDTKGREEDAFDSVKENVELKSPSLTISEESRSICSVALPTMEENKVTDNTDRDQQSPLRSVKKANSSSLLSRRRKSIGFLRVTAGDAEGSSTSTLFRDLFDNMEGKEEEAFDSFKENADLQSSSLIATITSTEQLVLHSYLENEIPGVLELNQETPTPIDRSKYEIEEPFASSYKENLTPITSSSRKEKKSIFELQRSSPLDSRSKKLKEEDAFTPNKENRTPKVSGTMRSNKSLSKSYDRIEIEMIRKRLERIPFQCLLENSPSGFADSLDDASDSLIDQAENTCVQSTRENGMNSPTLKDSSGTKGSKKPLSDSRDKVEREKVKNGAERVPFQSLMDNSSLRNNSFTDHAGKASSNLANTSFSKTTGEEKMEHFGRCQLFTRRRFDKVARALRRHTRNSSDHSQNCHKGTRLYEAARGLVQKINQGFLSAEMDRNMHGEVELVDPCPELFCDDAGSTNPASVSFAAIDAHLELQGLLHLWEFDGDCLSNSRRSHPGLCSLVQETEE